MEQLRVGSPEYQAAVRREGEYWGEEVARAVAAGIPFSVDMRRAERIFVHRGDGLPQQQTFDPQAERIMNGELYQFIFDTVTYHSPSARVLALTCGPGGLCLELARLGHHVHGIDISEGAIAIARRFAVENPFKETFGSLTYEVADLNCMELGVQSYDVILAFDGLHHILLLERLMQQIRQALKPDGLFIFSDNVGMHWLNRVLGGMLYLLLPSYVSYGKKVAIAWGGAKRVKEDMCQRSPFEEVSTESILELASRYFDFVVQRSHTGIGYRAALVGDLRFPAKIKYPFLRGLKKFDEWSVKHGLLKGDHVMVVAKGRYWVQ